MSKTFPDLYTDWPYLSHFGSWAMFNRVKNFFFVTLTRVFLGSNGFMMQPQGFAYTGDVIGLCMAMASAAYVVVKVVDHSVSFTLGFAH